jgi:hypothetical protein
MMAYLRVLHLKTKPEILEFESTFVFEFLANISTDVAKNSPTFIAVLE